MLYSGEDSERLYTIQYYPPAIACAVPFDGTQHVLPHNLRG